MRLCINLLCVAVSLKLSGHLNAMPAPIPGEASSVSTSLNFRLRDATLGYSPATDLGRESHLNYLKIVEAPQQVKIQDIRGFEKDFQLNVNGFAYVNDKVAGLEECKTDEELNNLLKPAAEKLVREMTQAKAVFAFGSRIRDKAPNTKGEGVNRTPVPSVHSDFSGPGAEEAIGRAILQNADNQGVKQLEELAKDPNNKLVIINIWRPLDVVKRNPLTISDWRSVDAMHDKYAYRPGGPCGVECMQWKFNPKNKWYYLSEQKPDEVAMFVQYDSATKGHMTVPHASLQGTNEKDLPVRRSIEIRVMAVLSKN